MIDAVRAATSEAIAVLRAAVDAGELPGAVFGVAHVDGGIVAAAGLGVAGPSGARVGTTTPFCLASTTKPLATTVLGALLDEGRLDLDDPVRALVPELPAAVVPSGEVTLRAVAAHTAGLGTHHRFFYEDEREPVPLAEAVRTLGRPVLPSDVQWRYSNLGYGVLQLALERAAGEPMAALVARTVLHPLGMADAAWGGALGPPGAASRHLPSGDVYPGYVTDHPAASEAWCSLEGVLRFGLAHAGRTLLAPATHDLLAAPAAPAQPDGARYALGWVLREHDGTRLLVHAGRMGGVGAHLVVLPDLGLAIAGMANAETDRLGEAVARVLGAALPGYAPPAPPPPWAAGRPHPVLACRWVGAVRFDGDELPVVLDAAGERVRATVAGAEVEVAQPHLQPGGAHGHLPLVVPHPLVPGGSLCHLDALPGRLTGDAFVPCATGGVDVAEADAIVGALVGARYPDIEHPRQGDAVSGALLLRREG